MDDGEEMEYGPATSPSWPPDTTPGSSVDEPCVVIDWQGFADYAKR